MILKMIVHFTKSAFLIAGGLLCTGVLWLYFFTDFLNILIESQNDSDSEHHALAEFKK